MDPTHALRPSVEDACRAWMRLVDADAEQVARVREAEPQQDHYAPVAGTFRPGQSSAAEFDALAAVSQREDVWLDIGAGGGRFALPLSRRVRSVIAIEPSPAMRRVLAEGVAAAGVTNLTVHDARWPVEGWTEQADVALAAHCVYDIREPIPFIKAMERNARRLCVVALARFSRGTQFAGLFEAVHGEPFQALPALHEFVALLGALGRSYEVRRVWVDSAQTPIDSEQARAFVRRMLWLRPGSDKDRRMCDLIDQWWGGPGGILMPLGLREIGIVTWRTSEI